MSEALVVRGVTLPAEFVAELRESQSLAEIAPEDRLIPHECYNVKLKVGEDWIPANRFFNTVSEEVSPEIDAVWLFLKKSRRYTHYSEDDGASLVCKSLDMKTGFWQAPEETRACETCPFQKWTEKPPACKEVWNFVGLNLATNSPFLVAVKSTSIKPVKAFLNTHFIGKLPGGGHLPLYVYRVKLKLAMPRGTYSVLSPVLGEAFTQEEIMRWHQMCQQLAQHVAASIDRDEPGQGGEREPEGAGGQTSNGNGASGHTPLVPAHIEAFTAAVAARERAGRMTPDEANFALAWAGRVTEQKVREKIDAWANEPEPPAQDASSPPDDPKAPIGAEGLVVLEDISRKAGVIQAALHGYMRSLWIGQDGEGVAANDLSGFPEGLYDHVDSWLTQIARVGAGSKEGVSK